MTSVVIVGAKRSPIGNFNGALSSLSAHEIGAQVILDILQTSGIKNSDVTDIEFLEHYEGTKPEKKETKKTKKKPAKKSKGKSKKK